MSDVNPEVYPEQLGRYRFSLGHEVGHWRLHRNVMAERRLANSNQLAFICRQSDAVTVPVEWQAETFASFLLPPRGRVWRNGPSCEAAAMPSALTLPRMVRHAFAACGLG